MFESKDSIHAFGDDCWKLDFILSDAFGYFLDLIPEAVIISDEDGHVILANRVTCDLLQYNLDEIKRCVVEDLVPKKIRDTHARMRAYFFADPKPRFLEGRALDLHVCRKDGVEVPIESALFAIQTDKGLVAVNFIRDISKQQDVQREITEFAFVDALTNLPNRRYFDEMVERNRAKSVRHHQGLALLYCDLDKFKPINDQYGHAYGDAVLKEIAARLLRSVREEDFLARLGGDEFAIIVYPCTDRAALAELATRIINVCSGPVSVKDSAFELSVSIGISYYDFVDCDSEAILRQADKAMYRAKLNGGNGFVWAD